MHDFLYGVAATVATAGLAKVLTVVASSHGRLIMGIYWRAIRQGRILELRDEVEAANEQLEEEGARLANRTMEVLVAFDNAGRSKPCGS